jgi:hypothetical protein
MVCARLRGTGEDWEAVVLLKCGCIALQAESGQGFEFALRFLDAFECIVPKRIYSVAKQCLECRYYHLSRSFEHERLCYNVMLTADIARM